jgi:hypothetical protein
MAVFDPADLYSSFTINDGFVSPVVGGTAVVFINDNPRRVALLFSASVGSLLIRPVQLADVNNGITITSGALPIVLTFAQFGGMVQRQWTVFSASGSTLYFCESIYTP